MQRRIVPAVLLPLLLAATTAAPQTPTPQTDVPQTAAVNQLSDAQVRELSDWLRAMKEWRAFEAKWPNRPAHDGWGRIEKRPQRPDPPRWLPAYCSSTIAEDPATVLACRLVDDPMAPEESLTALRQAQQLAAERPPKHSRFLEHLHIDGLWTTTAVNGRSYGLIGSHLTLVDVGRVQVFGPPGVLLLSVPDGTGSRRMEVGYTWGVSIRVADMRLFGSRDMNLFVNVTKVWVGTSASAGGRRAYDIVGLSIAPRVRPR
jgi:hypothetical protein